MIFPAEFSQNFRFDLYGQVSLVIHYKHSYINLDIFNYTLFGRQIIMNREV